MKKPKVLFAYCHELERSISIDEARLEYFAKDPNERKRFAFSCSDRKCGVLISGVNYHVMAEDGVKFKAAHYRSPHPHMPGCEWLQFTEDIELEQSANESNEEQAERKARKKLRDLVNHFTPWSDAEEKSGDVDDRAKLSTNLPNSPVRHEDQSNKKNQDRWQRYTKTNQLQRLIDTWQEAKVKLSYDEFKSLKLHVTNHGKVPFYHYITHIRSGLTNRYDGVIYGGGVLKKRYGRGFLFQFFDKHDDQTIHLYVSKEIMGSGRFGHYVDEVLNTENVKYFQVFLLNPCVSKRENAQGNTVINLDISDLRQLVVYYELKTNTSVESKAEGNCGDKCA
ncbi:hypothetical protein L1D25_13295 [Vibrio parahaemolyticus]|uniref:hypothetical protein n=2 Tax=Vibrio parahaemolyticus TaxID=670 RepID=UPI001EFD3928|nr:hypothetical protein [Vibrio parahaemolyticus]MCG9540177.1 hypothetical protein [Vibrio parahaemolyticus]